MRSSTDGAVTRAVSAEKRLRRRLRSELTAWSALALKPQGLRAAAHHKVVMGELEGLAAGRWDRLMLLLPPGSAKSTYTVLNVLMGTLGAMATSVVGYWVGSSAGSARKDERLATLANRG